jgi:hypothetical protein
VNGIGYGPVSHDSADLGRGQGSLDAASAGRNCATGIDGDACASGRINASAGRGPGRMRR